MLQWNVLNKETTKQNRSHVVFLSPTYFVVLGSNLCGLEEFLTWNFMPFVPKRLISDISLALKLCNFPFKYIFIVQ